MQIRPMVANNMGHRLKTLNSIALSGGQVLPFQSSFSESNNEEISFDEMRKDDSFFFDIRGNDVIVFLHIQKTGGTSFGRHLVRDLDLEYPCECKKGRKRCLCVRRESNSTKLWLFSRYSTGWKCGLHADWTELTNCVDTAMDETEKMVRKRRYFYITVLREPVGRFLSEFKHVQRGATWRSSRHWCGGRPATYDELPSCYNGSDWTDVSLDQFSDCQFNLAHNRQTRMLADLSLVGCYNRSFMSQQERDALLLASAKENLRKMAFFGLCEYQKISRYLFETTFKLKFNRPFIQINETHSSLTVSKMKPTTVNKIRSINQLDIELYDYAKGLLLERFEKAKAADSKFDENFSRLDHVSADENSPDAKIMKKIKLLKQQSVTENSIDLDNFVVDDV
ncbi:Heparan-sulfate 6-O-sulfotransferase 2 [Halotydeus destructor]|nr:Heparan-sulfate 6-O-sulfotransferase 2 [Halotydeus destructor]